MNNQQKPRALEIMNRIRDVLVNEWDPTGVRGLAPRDEYDFLIAGVYRQLVDGCSREALINHLRTTEKDVLGRQSCDLETLGVVAERLLGLDITFR